MISRRAFFTALAATMTVPAGAALNYVRNSWSWPYGVYQRSGTRIPLSSGAYTARDIDKIVGVVDIPGPSEAEINAEAYTKLFFSPANGYGVGPLGSARWITDPPPRRCGRPGFCIIEDQLYLRVDQWYGIPGGRYLWRVEELTVNDDGLMECRLLEETDAKRTAFEQANAEKPLRQT